MVQIDNVKMWESLIHSLMGEDLRDNIILALQEQGLTWNGKAIVGIEPEPNTLDDLQKVANDFANNYFPQLDNGLNIPVRDELRKIVIKAVELGADWQKGQLTE